MKRSVLVGDVDKINSHPYLGTNKHTHTHTHTPEQAHIHADTHIHIYTHICVHMLVQRSLLKTSYTHAHILLRYRLEISEKSSASSYISMKTNNSYNWRREKAQIRGVHQKRIGQYGDKTKRSWFDISHLLTSFKMLVCKNVNKQGENNCSGSLPIVINIAVAAHQKT